MHVWIKDSINFEGEQFALYKCATHCFLIYVTYLNQFFVILFIFWTEFDSWKNLESEKNGQKFFFPYN